MSVTYKPTPKKRVRPPFRTSTLTYRPVCEGIEPFIGVKNPILDHGFIRLLDYMGIQQDIVQSARVSYGGGTKSVRSDIGLIRYLMRHRHTTPMEMLEIKFHMQLPIFVARQFIRHRTANVNEYSARYSILNKEFYIPEASVIAEQSSTNNQGRGDGKTMTADQIAAVQNLLFQDAMNCYDHYSLLLNDPELREHKPDGSALSDPNYPGLARELARMDLSLNFYTQWFWKIDLHNLLNFLSLRADPHAQYEIRVYANFILDTIVKAWVPNVYEAFYDYTMNSFKFSGTEMDILRKVIAANGLNTLEQFSGLAPSESVSKREIEAFKKALNIV